MRKNSGILGFLKNWTVIGLALFLTSALPVFAAGLKVTDARLGLHEDDKIRLVIDLTEKADYRIFSLTNPRRVVIDLPEVEWNLPFPSGQRQAGKVDSVRYDKFRKGTSRLVLDLNAPMTIANSFIIPATSGTGQRLVIDLQPTTQETFTAEAGWPREAFEPKTASLIAVPVPKPRRKVIVIDPGHGGRDPGARSIGGEWEAGYVLTMSKTLKSALEKTGRYKVVLTRTGDTSLPLRERIAIARENDADLFISVHADAIGGNRNVSGASVYTLSNKASDKEAAELASKENQADVLLGVDMASNSDEVNDILIDLAMRDTMNGSAHFAQLLVRQLQNRVAVVKNTHRYASLIVLKAPDVPSVLLEVGYLSNKQDEKNLRSSRWRKKFAKAVVESIDQFFGDNAILEASR